MSAPPRRPVSLARSLAAQPRATDRQDATAALDGIFGGLKQIADALGQAAETARQQHDKAAPRVVFGYTLNTLDGAMQAFGHVPQAPGGARRKPGAAPVVPQARTPIVDVFEEAAALVVVAEVPGLDPAALTLAVEDGALRIEGGGAQRYSHRVALPGAVDASGMAHACRNGILEVRLPRAADAGTGEGA